MLCYVSSFRNILIGVDLWCLILFMLVHAVSCHAYIFRFIVFVARHFLFLCYVGMISLYVC